MTLTTLPASDAIAPAKSNANDRPQKAIMAQLSALRANPRRGFALLTENLDLCADPDCAAALVECATAIGRYDVAEAALPIANDSSGMLHAQLHMMQNRPVHALNVLKSRPRDARLMGRYFGLRIRAFAMIHRPDDAKAVAQEWADLMPSSPVPFKILERMLAAHFVKKTTPSLHAV